LTKKKETDMKIRSLTAIATVMTLAAAISVPSVIAQTSDLRVQIPYEFHAAGKVLPAGTYMLSKENPTTLRLRDDKGHSLFMSAGLEAADTQRESWIVIHKYGDKSFLRGAHWAGSGVALKMSASRAEQEVSRVANQVVPIRLAAK
jgi:hypothetical protein